MDLELNIILAEIALGDWYYVLGPVAVFIIMEIMSGGTGGFGGSSGSNDGFGGFDGF